LPAPSMAARSRTHRPFRHAGGGGSSGWVGRAGRISRQTIDSLLMHHQAGSTSQRSSYCHHACSRTS
jgi:hypothetical protein